MKNQVFASKGAFTRTLLAAALSAAFATPVLAQETEAELKARIQKLESELIKTKQALSKAKKESAKTAAPATEEKPNTDMLFDVAGGKLKVGGAIRVNYVIGDYNKTVDGAPSRAIDEGGTILFDTYRVNLDYTNGNVVGKFEYRFYDGYNFLHTGWLGYNYDNGSQVQVGVNRVPFGPGAYGVSQSWFFDQHFYLGLSDDMDLGVKYSWADGAWAWDAAYYARDEGSYQGTSNSGTRFSYDIVPDDNGDGFEERNQVNVRGIYSTKVAGTDAEIGLSAQYGQLAARGAFNDDGDQYAVSGHMVNKWNNWTLASQLTYYKFDVQQNGVDLPLIRNGAYNFTTQVASEGIVPAVSLSKYIPTPSIGWLSYAIPYVEFSSIIKRESGFNDSHLLSLGTALGTADGWYTYAEYVLSTGNDFIGGEAGGNRLGDNLDDRIQRRFNINFGYYF